MKTVLFVVGMQCAGKTQFTSTLANSGAKTCYIGEEIRKRIDVQTFENTENPYAPQISEAFAQEAMRTSIHDFMNNEHNLMVIDSAPRNKEQFGILIETNMFVQSIVVFVLEKYDVRLKRAIKKYDGKLSYFMKRETFENTWLDELKAYCKNSNIPTIVIGEV